MLTILLHFILAFLLLGGAIFWAFMAHVTKLYIISCRINKRLKQDEIKIITLGLKINQFIEVLDIHISQLQKHKELQLNNTEYLNNLRKHNSDFELIIEKFECRRP